MFLHNFNFGFKEKNQFIQVATKKKSFKKLHIKWFGFEFMLAM